MAKQKKQTLRRRDFLKAAGVTGAAAGAAVALSGTRSEAAVTDDGKKAGYQETEHVKTYYELARF
ncbi:MAG: twin-arginine translocation signal domain-containing protein [Rhodospirillales bacterium]|jgi:hypothetical protein|nr:twin-arginine translocation signal domain-containing protein [Rhodospirillales bacterium]